MDPGELRRARRRQRKNKALPPRGAGHAGAGERRLYERVHMARCREVAAVARVEDAAAADGSLRLLLTFGRQNK